VVVASADVAVDVVELDTVVMDSYRWAMRRAGVTVRPSDLRVN
jgi:hypothetical protein